MATPGYLITIGVGLLSTMAVGFTIGTTDGFGYQTPLGDLLG